jgi:hypothetical protein
MCSTGFSPPGCAGWPGCFQRRSESLLILDVIQYRSVALSYTTAGWPTARPGTFLYLKNFASRLSRTAHELRQCGRRFEHPSCQMCHSHMLNVSGPRSASDTAGSRSPQAHLPGRDVSSKVARAAKSQNKSLLTRRRFSSLPLPPRRSCNTCSCRVQAEARMQASAPCSRTLCVQHARCDECGNHYWITCSLKVTPSIQYSDPKPASKATDFGCTHQMSPAGWHEEELPKTASCTTQAFDAPRKQQDHLTLQEAIPIVVEP